MKRDTFDRLVRDALEHLNSRSHLASHPLSSLLAETGDPLSGDALRAKLLDSIEQLRPLAGPDSSPPDWRRYRHLLLRYVEGQGRDQIASALNVSLRQASRDHEQAINAVVVMLSSRSSRELTTFPSNDAGAPESSSADLSAEASLTDEMSRVLTQEENWADLRETINGVITTLEFILAKKEITCQIQVPDTIPPIAMSRTILRQVLLNLLSYVAATKPGARAAIGAADSAQGVILTIDVRDRVASSSTVASAAVTTDLPSTTQDLLEAVSRLVAIQGGSLARGESDRHAPFLSVVLPPISLRKVLVIDDNPDLVALFRRYVRGEPYRLIQATLAESAFTLVRELQPDAIILDVMLPTFDGWEVLGELRRSPDYGDIPIIVCSILPEQALAESLGVTAFLAKPVSRASLLTTLHRWVPEPDRRFQP